MSGEDGVTQAILGAMESAGMRDESPEPATEVVEPVAAEAAPAPDKDAESPAPAANDDEAEVAAIEAELRKDPKIKGRIPVHRHQAVLTRDRRRYEAEIAKREERLKGYAKYDDAKFQAKIGAFDLAEADPEKFLGYLALEDPRYRAILDARRASTPEPAKAPAPAIADDPEPKPDRLEDDGSLGWSQKGASDYVAWAVRQNKRELKEEFAKELKAQDEKYSPILTEHQQRTRYNTFLEKTRTDFANAREKWKGFKDNEAEIEKHFMANKDLTLFDSYREVVINKFEVDKTKTEAEVRARLVKEMNAAPAAPARPAPGDRPDAASDPNASTDDRVEKQIRAAYRKLAASEAA